MIPEFSIIIPTYNRAIPLKKLLDTFFAQTFTNFEIIIVNDGSTDNTEELIKQITDTRLNYYKKTNGGVSSARNFGIKKAKGKIINFFDSDDLAYSHHLKEAFNFFRSNPNADVVIFDYDWGNYEQTKFRKIKNNYKNPNETITKRNYISTNSIFFTKEAASQIHFSEKLAISEDWECWINLSLKYKFHLKNVSTTYIVEHEQRGVNNIDINFLINQKSIFINLLKTNKEAINRINLRLIESEYCSFISLQAAINKNKSIAIKYFIKSACLHIFTIFTKRTLAIIKHLIINSKAY